MLLVHFHQDTAKTIRNWVWKTKKVLRRYIHSDTLSDWLDSFPFSEMNYADKFYSSVISYCSFKQNVLKPVSAIFYFFTKWKPFKNYEKLFLFHLKSSFRSQDIQIFVFPSSPVFLPIGHCFRGWSKINLKV